VILLEDRPEHSDSERGEGPSAPEAPETEAAPDGGAETPPQEAGEGASEGEQSGAAATGPAETTESKESKESKESQEAKAPERGRYVVEARYGALPVTGMATVTNPSIPRSSTCIIKTKRGTEMGVTLGAPRPVEGDIGETIGHVLRRSTEKDVERQKKIEDELEPEELKYCRQKVGERGLRMRLSGVEHIWGGERIVFFFTSERRVDFRALVRDLAWHFHTRIELKQIGARDEARLLADYEHCGQPLCCKTFLRSLEPVTMRMAKLQRTTLDPSKISGRCGRLMCCLRFEDAVYRELRKGLPKRGMRVVVGSDEGVVASTEILTQEVSVRLQDGRMVRVPAGELRPPDASAPASAPAATPPRKAGPAEGKKKQAAPSSPKKGGRRSGPSGASSKGGKRGRSRRRGRQDARKAPAAGAGSPPSVRTKPARGRKGRRRGGRGAKGRQGGGGDGGGGSAGNRPSGGARKDNRSGD